MNIPKLSVLISQITNSSKLFRIELSETLMTSTEMRRRHKNPKVPGYGRLSKKPLKKRSGKAVQKQGQMSESSYFYAKQKEQLEQLKKKLRASLSLKKDNIELTKDKAEPKKLTARKTVKEILEEMSKETDQQKKDSGDSEVPKKTD